MILISTHAESDFADLIEEAPVAGFVPKSELSAERDRPARGARLLARLEECDHREHPPMILGGLGQPQLAQDAVHVLLDRALGDPETMGDPGVGAALSHQLEHLAFARAEAASGSSDAARGDELLHERGVDGGAALQDRSSVSRNSSTSVTRLFRR